MLDRVAKLPFFVALMGLCALAMIVPAAHALALDDFEVMRIFFYGMILFCILTLLVGLATAGFSPRRVVRSQLLTLAGAFTGLPLLLAIPFHEAVPGITFLDAWFEMVSCFTTTGATLFDGSARVPPSVHLWRGMVGWMGGFLVWVTALAILAPLNLGGFEVRGKGEVGSLGVRRMVMAGEQAAASERLARYSMQLLPVYVGLTGLLWMGLVALGEFPYVALIHAMSTLSTSGISAIDGLKFTVSGFWGELLIFVFFAFAISRQTFSSNLRRDTSQSVLYRDPEVVVAIALISATTLLLVLRHFFGALGDEGARDFFGALWGALFMVTSFLTTTGFESRFWETTTAWAAVPAPGIFLMALAMIGGGVATTAGGAKLLRVYALYRHSEREVERLLHPSSIGGGGKMARQIRKQGAYVSWVFVMLVLISVTVVMLLLALSGVDFEASMILSVAALSTTGPLAFVAGETPISYAELPDLAKVILAFAMAVGRLEALALIALFNPDFWRN